LDKVASSKLGRAISRRVGNKMHVNTLAGPGAWAGQGAHARIRQVSTALNAILGVVQHIIYFFLYFENFSSEIMSMDVFASRHPKK